MITLFRSFFAPPRHLILLLAALWVGHIVSEKRAERYGTSNDILNNIFYYSIFGYIIGGRFFFVLSNLSAFTQSPLNIFSINIDLFDPAGALFTAILLGFIYGQSQKLHLWLALDALTPLFAILAIGLSLSHLAAGTAFGKPANIPWGIVLWNATRHPTQIYELITSLLVFGAIWFRKVDSPTGSNFMLFAALTAGSRLFLEAFRGDSTLIFGGLRFAQIVSWFVLAATLFISEYRRKREHLN